MISLIISYWKFGAMEGRPDANRAFVFLPTPAFRRIRHATATNRRIQHSPVFEEIYFTSSARINFSPNPLHDLTGNRTEKAQLMIELNRRSWKLRIDYKFRNCISKFFYTCLFDFSQEKLDNIRIYSNVKKKLILLLYLYLLTLLNK